MTHNPKKTSQTGSCNRPIALIGMPGAGKSTIGVVLAKQLGLRFIDTDLCIQERAGATLQNLLDQRGVAALREAEQQVLLEEDFSGAVVATGGSVVYSDSGMQRLAEVADIVWLKLPIAVLETRLGNFAERGIASEPGTTLVQLYEEREPLYARWTDQLDNGFTVDCEGLSVEQTCAAIASVGHTKT